MKGLNSVELFKLLGKIAIDNDEAIKAIDDTSRQAKTASTETQGAFAKIGGAASKIATGIGIAGAALGGAWMAAIEGTREYRTHLAMLDTAFETSNHSTEAARQTFSDLNAVLGDSGQATEAAQHLAMLTKNEKELQTWTDICTGVYATFGEALPIEGLAEAANETAKTGELTGGLVDALNWAGHSEDEFQEKLDACTTEQQRQDLIMNTLNKTYKKASDQYKVTNKDVLAANKAQEKLTNAFAELGRIGEPILTAIKEKVAEFALAAIPHIENFIQKVKDISQWVKDNEDTIDTWVGVIIGAGTAIGTFLLILNWGSIMTAAANAVKVVRTAILAMNAAMLANPVGLVVATLAGLVAAFVYLWNNVDGFREFWINAWEIVKTAASTAWQSITKFFSDAWAAVKRIWATNAVIGFYKKAWTAIISVFLNAPKWFADKFRQAWNGIKNIWNGAKSFFSGIWRSVTGTFGNVGSWFRSKFSSAWTSIKSVFSSWGSFFGGLWTKIKSKFSSIGSSLGKAMGDSVKSGMNKVIGKIETSINKGISLINDAIELADKIVPGDIGKVAKISLPRLAHGGVLEKGQIGLLEGSGAEAVVPLEHNRAWLSRVAEDLHELQGNRPANVDTNKIEIMLQHILTSLNGLAQMQVFLDNGTLVGELVPAIDGRMADRLRHVQRGNVR